MVCNAVRKSNQRKKGCIAPDLVLLSTSPLQTTLSEECRDCICAIHVWHWGCHERIEGKQIERRLCSSDTVEGLEVVDQVSVRLEELHVGTVGL